MTNKTKFLAFGLIALFGVFYLSTKKSTQNQTVNVHEPAPSSPKPSQNSKGAPSEINIPQSKKSNPPQNLDISILLNNVEQDKQKYYSVSFSKKNGLYNYYQVRYQGKPIQNLFVTEKNQKLRSARPIENFVVDESREPYNPEALEPILNRKINQPFKILSVEAVWHRAGNDKLRHAYLYRINSEDFLNEQEWLLDAHSGEVKSINTFSRN